MKPSALGLVLPGGGARGAYQAGVLRAIGEIAAKRGQKSPFKIVTGVSAGAINASFLAAYADDVEEGSKKLVNLWENITADQVFRTDFWSFIRIGGRWMIDLVAGGLHRHAKVQALLDTSPLYSFLEKHFAFDRVRKNVEEGSLKALAVTATDYANSNSVTFVESNSFVPWLRKRRLSVKTDLKTEHVMASSAIPMFFPPVNVEGRYFGDGSLRNLTPLSPAIHLGSSRLIIISVKKPIETTRFNDGANFKPSAARVISVIMNALILDQTDFDVERLSRINQTLRSAHVEVSDIGLKPVDFLWIQPSEDLGELAKQYARNLPWIIRYLLRGLGSLEQAGEIISYLLFDPAFCSRLTEIGYRDAYARQAEIEAMLI